MFSFILIILFYLFIHRTTINPILKLYVLLVILVINFVELVLSVEGLWNA